MLRSLLIAPALVVTAKHCVVTEGGERLAPEGFRVGFGPSTEELVMRTVKRVAWAGNPALVNLATAAREGEDVAVLELVSTAPDSERIRDFALRWTPVDQEPVRLAGYGVDDLASFTSGLRGVGAGRISGLERATGIIEVTGDASCYGDSGGPVLLEDGATVLGVIGAVGRLGDGGFCAAGLTYAATAQNDNVRRFLAQECAAAGGCGAPANCRAECDAAAPDDEAPVMPGASQILPRAANLVTQWRMLAIGTTRNRRSTVPRRHSRQVEGACSPVGKARVPGP